MIERIKEALRNYAAHVSQYSSGAANAMRDFMKVIESIEKEQENRRIYGFP